MALKRIRRFRTRQAMSAKFALDCARNEAFQKGLRWQFACECYTCNTKETVDGGVAALAWLCSHAYHVTYYKGTKVEG